MYLTGKLFFVFSSIQNSNRSLTYHRSDDFENELDLQKSRLYTQIGNKGDEEQ